ncbi:MAG: DUF2975 domain-containing protein [Bacteroidota bacterium]
MEHKSVLILVMYWFLRVAFWIQLCVTLFIISLNSFDWMGVLHDEPLRYTVRGGFGMHPNVFKPDTTFHQLQTPDKAETIAMVWNSGWARFDYTDLTHAFTIDNITVTLLDSGISLLWLSITYLIYKMVESCKHQKVFEKITVRRIRLLALIVGFIGVLEYVKNWVFAKVAYAHISYDHFSIVMKKVDFIAGLLYMLFILVIAEVIRYGMSIKQENDLTI